MCEDIDGESNSGDNIDKDQHAHDEGTSDEAHPDGKQLSNAHRFEADDVDDVKEKRPSKITSTCFALCMD